jgi:hypothetical protein
VEVMGVGVIWLYGFAKFKHVDYIMVKGKYAR